MDGSNLPELLAQDLEFSESVFQSKDMTAGAPAPTLATYIGGGVYALATTPEETEIDGGNSQPQSRPDGMQPLTSIREKHSIDRLTELQNPSRMYDDLSETSSTTSEVVESPCSTRMRGQSIATQATSVNSRRISEASPKPLSKPGRIKDGTYLDFGDDSEDKNGLVGRPEIHRGDSGIEVPIGSPNNTPESLILEPPANIGRRSKPGPISIPCAIPARTVSQRKTTIGSQHKPSTISLSPSSKSPKTNTREGKANSSVLRSPMPSQEPQSPGGLTVPSVGSLRRAGPLRIELPVADVNAFARLSPFSPTASVQTWLDSNIVHSPLPDDNDDAGDDLPFQGLPLPQSVLNTLRLSTAYFPETLLLSSSLSIETIRTYSRKLRSLPDDIFGLNNGPPRTPSPWSPPPSPPEHHKKRLWPVFHRKASHTQQRPDNSSFIGTASRQCDGKYFDHQPSQHSTLGSTFLHGGNSPGHTQAAASTTSLNPPNWEPFKNIFVHGSEHLCDALYAHVVAYNYITSLCGRGVRIVEMERPKSAHHHVEPEPIQPAKIPRKAATLLGLSDVKAEISVSPAGKEGLERERVERMKEKEKVRRGTVPGLVHDPEPKPSVEHHGEKNALKELQSGLFGCVAKIVSALRVGEVGQVGTGSLIKGAKVPYIDPFLFRSLCEIVRCSEGGGSKTG